MRTLLAASGGGHLNSLLSHRTRLPFDPGEVTWFTMDTPQTRSLLAGEHVIYADPAPPRDWRAALRNARLAGAMMRKFRFDVAISSGASIAVSVLPIARRYGAKTYYIESAARVEGPSLSGRILDVTPGVRTYCQYHGWKNPRWKYAGTVFDLYQAGPVRPVDRLGKVVVTVGTQEGYPFDSLIGRLVDVLPRDAEVLWQTGATDPTPYGIDGKESVPATVLADAMAEADLVVAHSGVGSAVTALGAGAHPVLVPRRHAAGEHVDDHQRQVAEELHRRGLATMCWPEDIDLEVLMGAAARSTVGRTDPPLLDLD